MLDQFTVLALKANDNGVWNKIVFISSSKSAEDFGANLFVPKKIMGLGKVKLRLGNLLGCPRKLVNGWQMGYNPNIPHLKVGYNPFTNH